MSCVGEGSVPYTHISGDSQYKTRSLLSGVRGCWEESLLISEYCLSCPLTNIRCLIIFYPTLHPPKKKKNFWRLPSCPARLDEASWSQLTEQDNSWALNSTNIPGPLSARDRDLHVAALPPEKGSLARQCGTGPFLGFLETQLFTYYSLNDILPRERGIRWDRGQPGWAARREHGLTHTRSALLSI